MLEYHWIPKDEHQSGISFLCPHCRKTVTYHHGSSSASRKKSGTTKHCLYSFCPWCGKQVLPFGVIKKKPEPNQQIQEDREQRILQNIADNQLANSPTGFESPDDFYYKKGLWEGLEMAYQIVIRGGE